MRAMSGTATSTSGQKVPPRKSWYTDRPSTRTSTLLAMRRLKPRMETLLSLGFISAMSIPGTRRRISGMVAAPLIRISSSPMMVSEAGARVSELERAEAVTTCSSKMSSASASCVEESSAAISRAVDRVRRDVLAEVVEGLGDVAEVHVRLGDVVEHVRVRLDRVGLLELRDAALNLPRRDQRHAFAEVALRVRPGIRQRGGGHQSRE